MLFWPVALVETNILKSLQMQALTSDYHKFKYKLEHLYFIENSTYSFFKL